MIKWMLLGGDLTIFLVDLQDPGMDQNRCLMEKTWKTNLALWKYRREGWHPIYEMEHKIHVWNHQPDWHASLW